MNFLGSFFHFIIALYVRIFISYLFCLRALSAGCKKPLIVCPGTFTFESYAKVILLAALEACYVVSNSNVILVGSKFSHIKLIKDEKYYNRNGRSFLFNSNKHQPTSRQHFYF